MGATGHGARKSAVVRLDVLSLDPCRELWHRLLRIVGVGRVSWPMPNRWQGSRDSYAEAKCRRHDASSVGR